MIDALTKQRAALDWLVAQHEPTRPDGTTTGRPADGRDATGRFAH
jgi:hypothetical protein